jgi:hypothetical protein
VCRVWKRGLGVLEVTIHRRSGRWEEVLIREYRYWEGV